MNTQQFKLDDLQSWGPGTLMTATQPTVKARSWVRFAFGIVLTPVVMFVIMMVVAGTLATAWLEDEGDGS